MSTINILTWVFLGIGVVSFCVVFVDICMGRYQYMGIMNIAWPITALYSGPIGLFMYFMFGRVNKMNMDGERKPKRERKKPKWVKTYISATHCGAGCALADIISEITIFWVGIHILGHTLWASFFIDFGAALLFGFFFQYFNIKPMRPDLTFFQACIETVKADFFSLTAFQLGMYGWLLAVYYIYNGTVNAGMPLYWFMMQIGLTIGLLTTFPVNVWLIRAGIKKPCA